jgi:hypothetical protein
MSSAGFEFLRQAAGQKVHCEAILIPPLAVAGFYAAMMAGKTTD